MEKDLDNDTVPHEPDAPEVPGLKPRSRRWYVAVVGMVFCSWLLCYLALFMISPQVKAGPGLPADAVKSYPLYRFDSPAYRDIAESGFTYSGNPAEYTNIVFLPVFPLITKAVSTVTRLNLISAGFLVNHILFLAGCLLAFEALRKLFSNGAALAVVAGMCFSPGSFFFHSYYSETTAMFGIALCLFFFQRKNYIGLAVASCFLSGARTTVGPICLAMSLWLLWEARRAYLAKDIKGTALKAVLAPVCLGGAGCYLLYIWVNYSNPFVLLPEIQTLAWGRFHTKISLFELITFKHMFVYIAEAIRRPGPILLDYKTTNLVMTLFGIAGAFYIAFRGRYFILRVGYPLYMLLIYYSNAGSDFLISNYRHMILMIPIFLMLYDGYRFIKKRTSDIPALAFAGIILLISILSMLANCIVFSRGWWFYF